MATRLKSIKCLQEWDCKIEPSHTPHRVQMGQQGSNSGECDAFSVSGKMCKGTGVTEVHSNGLLNAKNDASGSGNMLMSHSYRFLLADRLAADRTCDCAGTNVATHQQLLLDSMD